MRNYLTIACILFIVFAAGGISAQPITAVSDPFTFPPITAVKMSGAFARAHSYFICSNPSSRFSGVRFAWSFPAQSVRQKGSLVVYSPLGRTLMKFSLSTNSGSVSWAGAREGGMGVYLAKITCGTSKQTAKFILYK